MAVDSLRRITTTIDAPFPAKEARSDLEGPEQPSPGSPGARPFPVRRVGLVVLAAQLVGLLIWSQVLSSRFAMGSDFIGYGQAWFQMAHGHLNPYVTGWSENFLSDHGSFIVILLSPLWWVWPHAVTLLWVQSAAIVFGETVAFVWMCEVAAPYIRTDNAAADGPGSEEGIVIRLRRSLDAATVLPLLGLVLLVANPWIYWTASFDFHFEVIGASFALLLAYDIAHHRRRAWIWAVVTLLCGDVCITYVFGVGLSAVLAGRPWRNKGLVLMGIPVLAFGAVNLLGLANGSSAVGKYLIASPASHTAEPGLNGWRELLHSFFKHPSAYLDRPRNNLVNVWANVAPAGGIGLACAWGFGVPFVVLLQNSLTVSIEFSSTAFQNFPVYLFVAFGTILVLTRILVRRPRIALTIGVLILASAIGWCLVWFPKTSSTWLRVSPAAAKVLNATLAHVPPNDEVVASHGIMGAFAERTLLYEFNQNVEPVQSRHVIFITAPDEGINTESVQANLARLSWLAGPLHGRLLAHGGGVWVFDLATPEVVQHAFFPTTCPTVPAWALAGDAASAFVHGPSTAWGARATGRKGYVVSGDYWRLRQGNYVAGVKLAAGGPVSVQVWDENTNAEVAQLALPGTHGMTLVTLPFASPRHIAPPAAQGVGPFRIKFALPPPVDQLEVRVSSPGNTSVKVKSITVLPAAHTGAMQAAASRVC